jgi:hypothetical protein
MSRGLRRLGWEVELLRCKHPHDSRLRDVIESFPGRVVTAPFFGPFSSLANRKGMRRAIRLWWRLLGQIEQSDYPELTASRFARFVQASSVSKASVILGITTGQLESFASAARLSAQLQSPLVLEYRDPLPHPGSAPLESSRRLLLERCISQAARIITTTQGLTSNVAREFPAAAAKLKTIYSCYDDTVPPPPCQPSQGDRLILVHAGALHGGRRRNARSLVQGIAEAVKANHDLRGKIQLRLIGAANGGTEAIELARELSIPWAVELLPQMPHAECLAQLDRAHALVVIKFDDAEYDLQIPGKTFLYLGRGKPILGIMRETEAARILRLSGIGMVRDHSDIVGTAAALFRLWLHRNELGTEFRPDWEYIRQFSLTAMSEKFNLELSGVAAAEPVNVNGSRRLAPAGPQAAVN